jgi:NhaP-type Na+/H+ or K+/H+ antiporter
MDIILLVGYAVVLICALLFSYIAHKLKIPKAIPLLAAGVILGMIKINGVPWITFPDYFVTAVATLALIMFLFHTTSLLKIKEFEDHSKKSFWLVLASFFVNFFIVGFFSYILFNFESVYYSIVLAILVSATRISPHLLSQVKKLGKMTKILELESYISIPVMFVFSYVMVQFIQTVDVDFFYFRMFQEILPLAQEILIGLGAGVLVGIITFRFVRHLYKSSNMISPLVVLVLAVLTYLISEYLAGNSILAVATLGLFVGNIYFKDKKSFHEHSFALSTILEITVLIIVGIVVQIPFDWIFVIKAIVLFAIYHFVRLGIMIILFRKDMKFDQKVFMTWFPVKGISEAIAALYLSAYMATLGSLGNVLSIVIIFILCSVVVSTIVMKANPVFFKFLKN